MFKDCFNLSHLLLIVGIALLCFGPRKFADFGRGLGDGIRNFNSALKQTDATSEHAGSDDKNGDNAKETL
jgi:sec-independent protein translocase protein TatA